jgi:queuine tRNA-ribosyltransferase
MTITSTIHYECSRYDAAAFSSSRQTNDPSSEDLAPSPPLLPDERPVGAIPPPASSFPPFAAKDYFRFKVLHESTISRARVCRIETPNGSIDTPGFVAVGTNAALKAVPFSWADASGLQLAFANTYHLLLHPGADVVAAAGGLHAFMGRPGRPLITDSGGFQVFSLAYGTVHDELHSLKRSAGGASLTRRGNLVQRIDEEGVVFKSYRDGTAMMLSPESSVAAQKKLGADIILPLDQLAPYHVDDRGLRIATARSHRWEARSLMAHLEDVKEQAMFGIVHGGSDLQLRAHSAMYVSSLPFDGTAIGGALGQHQAEMLSIVKASMALIPRDKPVHVLGIADPKSSAALASLGVDTMDSCFATRVGRHGGLLTNDGTLRVAAGYNKHAHRSPVNGCECITCRSHSLSYLHHLVKAREPLAATLISLHNIHFMCEHFRRLRERILRNEL